MEENLLPWLLTATLLSFFLFSPLTPSPPLSAPMANDSNNMHLCGLTGRAFEMYHYIGSYEAEPTVQQGCYYEFENNWDCSLCVCCVWCSPIRSRLCFKCLWYKPLQFWLRLRVWLPLGLMSTLHFNLCRHPWQCNVRFGLVNCLMMPEKTEKRMDFTSRPPFYWFISCFPFICFKMCLYAFTCLMSYDLFLMLCILCIMQSTLNCVCEGMCYINLPCFTFAVDLSSLISHFQMQPCTFT